jgi:uncharacterized protein (DUF1800 family)
MTNPTEMNVSAIAVNRFGLGARAEDAAPSEPKRWLLDQLDQYQVKPASLANQPNTVSLIAEYTMQQQEMRKADDTEKKDMKRTLRREAKDIYQDAVSARVVVALTTSTPFMERLVHFWSNHFAVSIEKPALADLAGAFEFEAIRPNILGNFKDLLFAVERHPAMLIYLDQAKSIGPNSIAGRRSAQRQPDKKRGLNENLAREIMELHTLGVRSGYTQTDVTEFARALTGWSIAGMGKDKDLKTETNVTDSSGFVFRQMLHEPGIRNMMGKTYPQTGKAQAEVILTDLASSQATAIHLATKLARHFVGDNPPANLVDKLAQAYMASNGDLTKVYRALIEAPESWISTQAKFKTPCEWLISSLRALGKQNLDNIKIGQILNQLGQPTWKPGSPAGFDDVAATWAGPNALLRRVELAQRLVAPLGDKLDARVLGDKVLLGAISLQTKTAISRSESASTGLALLLVSPEFLRR